MDEFAQSREDDDLFADEFEPISGPATVVETSSSASTGGDLSMSIASGGMGTSTARANDRLPAARPRNVGRGGALQDHRRGGRGGIKGGGLGASRYAPQAKGNEDTANNTKIDIATTPTSQPTSNSPKSSIATETETVAILPPTMQMTAITDADLVGDGVLDSTQKPVPLTEPQAPQQSARPTAVRGDRHLTGGPAHKKLTEEELSEKMEKMKILNAQKAERFRLSEEDSAAYARKEKEMEKKKLEEQKNARAMDMERAKNRQRKLAAQGVREWDSEKQESDIVDGRGRGRRSEYVRGGHGGVIRGGLAESRYAQAGNEDAESNSQSSKGRGGFEIRGRGSRRGRGGIRGGIGGGKPIPATIPTKDDFPELPTPPRASAAETKAPEEVKSPINKPAGDWAEEMATPVEDEKLDI